MEPGKPAYLKLREEFGSGIFDDENGGVLIREKLGQMVFSDPEVYIIYSHIIFIIWKKFCIVLKFFLSHLFYFIDTFFVQRVFFQTVHLPFF